MLKKLTLGIVLVLVFANYLGMGLVFPVFSPLLFSNDTAFLPVETSLQARGLWLGILIALMPLGQFFTSPIWGAVSDSKGRKVPLIASLLLALLGYLLAAWGIAVESLWQLAVARLMIGVAAGNNSILQATIADISTDQEKPKHYSLFSMATGFGFTLGPIMGGFFSGQGYEIPFFFTAALFFVSFLITVRYFKDTVLMRRISKIYWLLGITQLKRAFTCKGLRIVFVCSFIAVFGWYYFFELFPVFLIQKFSFSSSEIGLLFGIGGACYTLSTGVLIRPLFRRIAPLPLFLWSTILSGIVIVFMLFLPSSFWLFPAILLVFYFTAPFSPAATTIVSNGAPPHIQGEVLGILGSVWAAAYILAPLLAGAFVGKHPESSMWIGGGIRTLAGLIGAFLMYSSWKKLRRS